LTLPFCVTRIFVHIEHFYLLQFDTTVLPES